LRRQEKVKIGEIRGFSLIWDRGMRGVFWLYCLHPSVNDDFEVAEAVIAAA
jgi:hypothetical protein